MSRDKKVEFPGTVLLTSEQFGFPELRCSRGEKQLPRGLPEKAGKALDAEARICAGLWATQAQEGDQAFWASTAPNSTALLPFHQCESSWDLVSCAFPGPTDQVPVDTCPSVLERRYR